MTPMNIKDSESADDESSGEESTPTKGSPAKQKRKSSRIPPEGREKPRLTCSMTRDDVSMESIHGVSGSMVDLVKGKINIYYQTYKQCYKIGKNCNLKSAKNTFFAFSKMEKNQFLPLKKV